MVYTLFIKLKEIIVMKFYQLNYYFGDPLKSVFKYYRNRDNAKRAMDQLISQALTQEGAEKYSFPSHGHFYAWVTNNKNTILNVDITELNTED